MGSGAKSYMRKGFLIYEEMRKYLVLYEEAVSHKWLCTWSFLNFPISEENFIFIFYQCGVISLFRLSPTSIPCLFLPAPHPFLSIFARFEFSIREKSDGLSRLSKSESGLAWWIVHLSQTEITNGEKTIPQKWKTRGHYLSSLPLSFSVTKEVEIQKKNNSSCLQFAKLEEN